MIKDFEISEKRSKSGKNGMSKRYGFCYNKTITNDITNDITNVQQNTESESEYENSNNILLEGGVGETPKNHCTGEETFCEVLDELSFEKVWKIYGRKGNKKTSKRKWDGLPKKARELAVVHIPRYVEATPEIQYRKNFETYINQEVWNDEIILNNNRYDKHGKTQDGITKNGGRTSTI